MYLGLECIRAYLERDVYAKKECPLCRQEWILETGVWQDYNWTRGNTPASDQGQAGHGNTRHGHTYDGHADHGHTGHGNAYQGHNHHRHTGRSFIRRRSQGPRHHIQALLEQRLPPAYPSNYPCFLGSDFES